MIQDRMSKRWQIDAAGLGVCLAISGLAYLIGLAPLVRQAAAVQSQKQQLAHQKRQVSKLRTSRSALDQQLTRAREAVAVGTFKLRPVDQLNGYLAQLTALATASNLTLYEIQPGQAINQPNYRSVPVVMSGVGSYRTCALFLRKLHDVLPDTRLSSLELAASDSTRKPGSRFRLNLVWYATRPHRNAVD